MSEITEYEILNAESRISLNADVRMWIRDGYQPFGAPFHAEGRVWQAMVKYGGADKPAKPRTPKPELTDAALNEAAAQGAAWAAAHGKR